MKSSTHYAIRALTRAECTVLLVILPFLPEPMIQASLTVVDPLLAEQFRHNIFDIHLNQVQYEPMSDWVKRAKGSENVRNVYMQGAYRWILTDVSCTV